MNRQKLFIYFSPFIILFLTMTLSCTEEEKNQFIDVQKTISLVQLDEGDDLIKVIVDPAQRSQVTLQAEMDNKSAYGIVVEIEMKSELIDDFNKKHGTHYQELPPASYSLEAKEFIFPKFSEKSSHVIININSVGMETGTEYLLPVQMVLIKGDSKASINPTSNVRYILVSKLAPPSIIHLKDLELTTEIGSDKKNWFAAYATNKDGGHTFSVEEAAEKSSYMDFVLLKFGSNLRIHPSNIGWQHGGDYFRYLYPYIDGFKKLTHIVNMNKLFKTEIFNEINTSEDLVAKVEELKNSENYNFYVADRMTSHNLQSQLTGDNRVLMQGYGPRMAVNSQFSFIYIKEVIPINGGVDYKIKFDVKYIDVNARDEALKVENQNVIIDNPGYNSLNEIVEYKNIELTTEIGADKKNWFSAYADNEKKTFTQEEAKNKSNMMDFALVNHEPSVVRFYNAMVGQSNANYKDRIAPYVGGFSKLTYTMLGGWRPGTADETKIEHYQNIKDVTSLTNLIKFYNITYGYPIADRMISDNLAKDKVGVIGWGNLDQATKSKYINNAFGIYIIRDVQPQDNGHYKVIFDIKVPKKNVRQNNNTILINN